MGVCLNYVPSRPLSQEVQSALRAAAIEVRPLHSWWCEPIHFFDSPELGFFGMNKIFMSGYSLPDGGFMEVDNPDDMLLAWNDCRVIAAHLSEWARKFGIEWSLTIEGESFGAILPTGEFTPELISSLSQLKQMSGFSGEGEALVRRIGLLEAKYSTRG